MWDVRLRLDVCAADCAGIYRRGSPWDSRANDSGGRAHPANWPSAGPSRTAGRRPDSAGIRHGWDGANCWPWGLTPIVIGRRAFFLAPATGRDGYLLGRMARGGGARSWGKPQGACQGAELSIVAAGTGPVRNREGRDFSRAPG